MTAGKKATEPLEGDLDWADYVARFPNPNSVDLVDPGTIGEPQVD